MSKSAYKDAGVDIHEAAKLVQRIKPHVKKTERPGTMGGIGGFGALFDLKATDFKDPVLVSSTDGVGTKIKIAIETNHHNTIGIDCVAMCVNDIVAQGAEPLFFLDYFACGKLVNDVAETVIAGIAEGCRMAGCALIGGETAEMPGMYAPDDYDLAGFTVGAVERDQIITGSDIAEGDVLIGLASNGLHSNGFSLVRKIVKTTQGYDYDSQVNFETDMKLGELLLMPTRIYVKSLLEALKIKNDKGQPAIKGMANITGGALFENIPRMMPEGLKANIDASNWELPVIFHWLKDIGKLSNDDLGWTLNCGLGMVVACAPEHANALTKTLVEQGETVFTIGGVTKRNQTDDAITITNLETSWSKPA